MATIDLRPTPALSVEPTSAMGFTPWKSEDEQAAPTAEEVTCPSR